MTLALSYIHSKRLVEAPNAFASGIKRPLEVAAPAAGFYGYVSEVSLKNLPHFVLQNGEILV